MQAGLKYETLEKLNVNRPVDRLGYIANCCRGKTVLDIGCLDETALVKRDTEYWLHGRIGSVAREVVGVDNSSSIPPGGLVTGPNSVIRQGDAVDIDPSLFPSGLPFDLIVAGEFIEHVENPLQFMRAVKRGFAGKELILSTPNGASFANALLGAIGREAQHHDHLHAFTFKVLNTLCLRAGFESWEIVPYRFYATEMILNSTGLKRLVAQGAQSFIRFVERLFPLLSSGYILKIRV